MTTIPYKLSLLNAHKAKSIWCYLRKEITLWARPSFPHSATSTTEWQFLSPCNPQPLCCALWLRWATASVHYGHEVFRSKPCGWHFSWVISSRSDYDIFLAWVLCWVKIATIQWATILHQAVLPKRVLILLAVWQGVLLVAGRVDSCGRHWEMLLRTCFSAVSSFRVSFSCREWPC